MQTRAMLSVCLSVRQVREFCQNEPSNIKYLQIIFTVCIQAILVFPNHTGWQYSDGNPPNGGVECRWGMAEIAILSLHLASLRALNAATG